jgi:hypothetical protein
MGLLAEGGVLQHSWKPRLRQPVPSPTDLESDRRQGVVGRNRGLRPGVDPGYVARPPWRILRGDRTTPTEIGGVPAAQVLGPKC